GPAFLLLHAFAISLSLGMIPHTVAYSIGNIWQGSSGSTTWRSENSYTGPRSMSDGENGNPMLPSLHSRPGKSVCRKVTRITDITAFAMSCVLATASASIPSSWEIVPADGSHASITPFFP